MQWSQQCAGNKLSSDTHRLETWWRFNWLTYIRFPWNWSLVSCNVWSLHSLACGFSPSGWKSDLILAKYSFCFCTSTRSSCNLSGEEKLWIWCIISMDTNFWLHHGAVKDMYVVIAITMYWSLICLRALFNYVDLQKPHHRSTQVWIRRMSNLSPYFSTWTDSLLDRSLINSSPNRDRQRKQTFLPEVHDTVDTWRFIYLTLTVFSLPPAQQTCFLAVTGCGLVPT